MNGYGSVGMDLQKILKMVERETNETVHCTSQAHAMCLNYFSAINHCAIYLLNAVAILCVQKVHRGKIVFRLCSDCTGWTWTYDTLQNHRRTENKHKESSHK